MALFDVIKYNGGPDVLAWKYPSEELGTWSQLIVNESQEAVLVKGGQVFDVFGPGRHTLSTANIPLLRHVINLPFGGRSPFTAEVWYINRAYNLGVLWGPLPLSSFRTPNFLFSSLSAPTERLGSESATAGNFLSSLSPPSRPSTRIRSSGISAACMFR